MIRSDWLCRCNNIGGAWFRSVAWSALIVCLVSACESGSGANPENAPGSITAVSTTTGQLSVNAGSSISVPITVERTSSFIGTVELALDGIPNGVTHSFSPSVLSFGQSTSILKLDLNQGAQAGNYPLIIRASARSVEPRSVTITLSIPVPDVTVSAGNGSISIALEDTVSIPITLTRTGGGFIDPVTLSLSGLVSGVSARFEPSVLTGSAVASTLKLSADIGAALGASTPQIVTTGVIIGEKRTPLPITVVDAVRPTFQVRPSFPNINMPFGGGTVEQVIGVPRAGGLSAPINLTVEGLPANVVATLEPTAVTGASSIIRLSASRNAIAGTYPLTVRGVAMGAADRVGVFTGTVSGVRPFAQAAPVKRGNSGELSVSTIRFGTYTEAASFTIESPVPGFGFTGVPFAVPTVFVLSGRLIPFTVADSVVAGTYTFIVRVIDSSGVVATTDFVVTVTN